MKNSNKLFQSIKGLAGSGLLVGTGLVAGVRTARLLRLLQGNYSAEEQKEIQQRFGYFQGALERYGEKVGTGHKRILIPKTAVSEKALLDHLNFTPVIAAIPEAGQVSFRSFRHPENYHIHDLGKVWTMHKDEHAAVTMKLRKSLAGESKESLGEILSEGAAHFLSEGVPGTYYYLKGQLTGAESIAKRLERELNPYYLRKARRFEPIRENRFSAFDDAWNWIEGFSEKGLSSIFRKVNTDFGSGYDGAKALAKSLGMSFDELLGLPSFRKALTQGKKVKTLGKGSFGITELWKTTVGKEEFEYVVKKPIVNKEFIKKFGSRKKVKEYAEVSLKREYGALAGLHESEMIPSAYMLQDNKLFMEKMPGKTLLELKRDLTEEEGIRFFDEVQKVMQQHDIINWDIARRNIMYDPSSKRLSWIDWGMAKSIMSSSPDDIDRALQNAYSVGAVNSAAEYSAARFGSAFSAKDDSYNVITGLNEEGLTAYLRKTNTEFGSGWRGIVSIPKTLQPLFTFKGQHRYGLTKAAINKFKIQTGKKIRSLPKSQQTQAFKELEELAEQMSLSGDKSTILINPLRVKGDAWSHIKKEHQAALLSGDTESKAFRSAVKVLKKHESAILRGTILHERFHQAVNQLGYRNAISKFSHIVPESYKKPYLDTYIKEYGRERAEAMITEEYLAHSFSHAYLSRDSRRRVQSILKYSKGWRQIDVNPPIVKGDMTKISKDAELSVLLRDVRTKMKTPSINRHEASRVRKELQAARQRDTMIAQSINGLMGGKGHTRKHNMSTGGL